MLLRENVYVTATTALATAITVLVTATTAPAIVIIVTTVAIVAAITVMTTTALTADQTARSLVMEPVVQEWKFFLDTEPSTAESSLDGENGSRIKALLTEYMVYNDLAVAFLKENNLIKCKYYIEAIVDKFSLTQIEQIQRFNVCKTILIYLDAQATKDNLLLSDQRYLNYISFINSSSSSEVKAFLACVEWINSYKLVEDDNPLNYESVETTFEQVVKPVLDTIKPLDSTYYYLIIRNIAMVKRYLKKTYESDEYLMLLPE